MILKKVQSHKVSVIAIMAALLCLVGVMQTFRPPAYAQSGGGAGSGGGGAGCTGTFWCTGYGWGWGEFDVNGTGPSDRFRDGDLWPNAQNTCRAAGASTILVHIIQDSDYSGRGYDYHTSQEGMQYKMPVGSYIDNGRARVVAVETAQAAFNDARNSGAAGGLTFGVNVAWVCYNFAPPDNASCSITLSPASVTPGGSFTANFTVRNTGGVNWSVDPSNPNRYKLGTENARDNSTWGSNRQEIPGDPTGYGLIVFAGATKTFSRSFTAPSSPGSHSFSWRVLKEGEKAIVGTACSATLTVGTSSSCAFTGALPPSVIVGSTFTVGLRLVNGSGHTWTAATSTGSSGHKIGSESPRDNTTWGDRRWLMPTINNGSQADVSVTVTAPSTPGTYTLAFGVLSESVHWEFLTPCSGTVNVTPQPAITCPGQANPPHYTISMPRTYNDPDYTGSIAWSAPGPTRHTTQTSYNSHEDISDSNWGGGDVPPTLVSQYAGNPGSVTLNYTPYQQEYPYDYNQPRVHYTDTYFTRYYSLGAPYYYDEYRWNYYPDPDGTGPQTAQWKYEYYRTVHGGYYVTSYSSGSQTTARQVDGPVLPINGPPCFREYDSTVSMTLPQLDTDDRESPTRSRATATINIQFDTNDPDRGRMNMRQASRANNLPYQFHYQIQRFGAAVPTTTSGGWILNTNSSTTIGANSNARTATGAGSVNSNSVTVSVEQNASDLRVGDRVCWRFTVTEERGNINPPGTRSSTAGTESTVACSSPVVNWPYLEVFGNDIVSGGSFTGGCTNSAQLRSRFRPSQARGTSAQYAVFALGTVSGVTSASLRNDATTPAIGPLGLTFANTSGTAFGGGYAANDGIACMPDYFGSRPTTPGAVETIANFLPEFNTPNDPDPNKIEYYEINGSYTHNAVGPGVRNGVRKVFYVHGTLNINTDIRYQNTTWNDRNNVPFVVIIARDINIDPGVTQLDGVYVAQPSGGGTGTISTCTTNYGACRNPLVINGGFVAERVNFFRTRGSLRNSVVNEGRVGVVPGIGGNNSCSVPWGAAAQTATNTGTAGGNTCGAEIFSFSPEVYLSLSQILIPEDSFKLDSYVTLPPNL